MLCSKADKFTLNELNKRSICDIHKVRYG